MSLVTASNIGKIYRAGDVEVSAIKTADFEIQPKSFVSFVGPSGSGKSTLLNMIGCLDRPTSGTLRVVDTDISGLDRKAAARFRGQHIGFIFQDFNLLPVLTVAENVEYPLLMVQDWPAGQRRERVREILEAVDILEQADKYPQQLSGGQKQRVAVARALVTHAKLILADEPTANLDHATAYRIIDLMKRMRDEFDSTFIFSTHDPKIMDAAEVVYVLEDGRVSRQEGGARHG
jgi:putative ABC transport system ATP-binding protein